MGTNTERERKPSDFSRAREKLNDFLTKKTKEKKLRETVD